MRSSAATRPGCASSCYHCVVRCPQEIEITDVMYAIKVIAEKEHTYPNNVGPDFAGVFIGQAKRFGRSWEIGLTARHYLRHYIPRLPGMTPMAFGLFAMAASASCPHQIHGKKQLQAILRRADELERADEQLPLLPGLLYGGQRTLISRVPARHLRASRHHPRRAQRLELLRRNRVRQPEHYFPPTR